MSYKYAMDLIRREEGFRSESYRDSKGIRTIGYGFTEKFTPAIPFFEINYISKKNADILLENEVKKDFYKMNEIIPDINEKQAGILCSLLWNVGPFFWRSKLLEAILNKQDNDIKKEWLNWDKITLTSGLKVQLSGLTQRRKREYNCFQFHRGK